MDIRVFIGASSEQNDEVGKIAGAIDKMSGVRASPWNRDDLFSPGSYTLEKLVLITREVDAALFVFGQDDRVEFRDETNYQPRDNVLIEYGLFLGQLGREYVAFYRKGAVRTARDLNGVTYIDALKGWNNSVEQSLKKWLGEVVRKKKGMSGRLERILHPAIEFKVQFPPGNRATAKEDPILTDINNKGKTFFQIDGEGEYIGESTTKLMDHLKTYVDPPAECWEDLMQDQKGVYARIKRGDEAHANVAVRLNKKHIDYRGHVFVPLLAERRVLPRLDENIDELSTVVYLDVGKLPKHVFGEQIWKDVSDGFSPEQLANELDQIAGVIEAAAPRVEKLRDAVLLLHKGGGPKVIELCSEVGLYSILHHATDGSAVKEFLERLLDPFVHATCVGGD